MQSSTAAYFLDKVKYAQIVGGAASAIVHYQEKSGKNS